MLYLVATPIGNLEDITFRAVATLKNCDYILCEDTRHSSKLLSHYQISKPLKSFFKFNECAKQSQILHDLESGMNIALISDAGTPGISDPGTQLVQACIEKKIPVTVIPGPCAAIAALTLSGLDTDQFQFQGFLPKKKAALKKFIQDLLPYPSTSICYESPLRLKETLKLLHMLAADRQLVVVRELTKKFEEVVRGTAEELLLHWNSHEIKGEIVLLIAGQKTARSENWEAFSPIEHVAWLQKTYSLDKLEAIKLAAKIRGVSKRDIYNVITQNET